MRWLGILLIMSSLSHTVSANNDQTPFTLALEDTARWYSVDDSVMGGISRSLSGVISTGEFAFVGQLSTANNGGFASIRRELTLPRDLAPDSKVRIRVQGDGRAYQLRFRTASRMDGIAYATFFQTEPDQILEYEFSLADFKPVWRGRTVPNQPALTWPEIAQMGLMLTSKDNGEFVLIVHAISWTK